jgi:hypothetical protein
VSVGCSCGGGGVSEGGWELGFEVALYIRFWWAGPTF